MDYLIHLGIIFSIYAILSLGLNLVVGYAGLLSLAQAAFYGIGAYSTAILLTSYDFNFFVSVVVGILINIIVAFAAGLILSRFRDDYYALGSLGLTAIFFGIFLNWQSLTRGPLGIPGIDKPELFGLSLTNDFYFLILCLVFLGLIYAISDFISRSSFSRALKAFREDETALKVFGYNTPHFKLTIFIVGAVIASVAGSLFASYISYIDPSTFGITESILILSIIILGGLANLRGSIFGALLLVLLPEFLRFIGFPADIAAQMRQAVYGLLLVLLMLYRPQGFFGEYKL